MIRVGLAFLLSMAPVPATAQGCDAVRFDGADFTVCKVDLTKQILRLWLNDESGAPLGSFTNVNRELADSGQELGIAMNAGMYHADRSPVGHYVEDGQEYRGVITADGPGNFGLLPNGVLCLVQNRAQIVESRQFDQRRPACDHATQSGPMLVIDGALHPRFLHDSTSLYIRNGIGVSDDGSVAWLAISDERINFHTFGRLFRDGIGAGNALYFDGNISRLYDGTSGRHDFGLPMGPIIGTVRQAG